MKIEKPNTVLKLKNYMKGYILFLGLLLSINLSSQNDKPNREPRTMKLVFEQELEESPYFIKDKALQLFSNEMIFVETEIEADSIKTMKVVTENLFPNKTIMISFSQEISDEKGNLMMLKIENPFNHVLLFDAIILTPNASNWTKTSVLPIQPNVSGIEIWHDVILSLVIDNWKLKKSNNTSTIISQHKTEADEKHSPQKTYKWLKRNNLELNKLHLAKNDEINYVCDSSLYLKQIIGDTIRYWTYGWRTPIDTLKAMEWIENPTYGKTSYLKKVNWDGRLTSVSLTPRSYRIENDSLFELEQFYKISQDSLSQLFNLAYLGEDKEKRELYKNIIAINSYNKFKLIYHPSIFKNNIYDGNCNNDKIELIDVWECNNKEYFAINISNFRSNGEEKIYTLIFDENYKWLEYDGCDAIGIDCMKSRNFKVHYR